MAAPSAGDLGFERRPFVFIGLGLGLGSGPEFEFGFGSGVADALKGTKGFGPRTGFLREREEIKEEDLGCGEWKKRRKKEGLAANK